MTRTEFFKQLEIRLGSIPQDERNKIIEYYAEIINDKAESGESEENIFRSLGSPETIAQNILEENGENTFDVSNSAETNIPNRPNDIAKNFKKPQKPTSVGKIIGFSFLLPFVFTMFAIWGVVVLSFLIAALALAVSGIGYGISSFFLFVQSFSVGLCQLGIGLTAAALSIFVGYGSWAFAKLYGRAVKKMFGKYKCIYGGEYHA